MTMKTITQLRKEQMSKKGSSDIPLPKRLTRIQRFHVRCRFLGLLHWVCPFCGHINASRLMQRRYVTICFSCDNKFVPQVNLATVPLGGRRTTPPDYIIPDNKGSATLQDAFPLGDLMKWRQGGCLHGMTELPENSPLPEPEEGVG